MLPIFRKNYPQIMSVLKQVFQNLFRDKEHTIQ